MENREILLSQVFGLAGAICIGSGLLGLAGHGAVLHPALEGRTLDLVLLGAGAMLMAIELRIMLPVLLRRAGRGTRSR